ncbi:Hypothetical predicted protein [Marmota monax]|uniref:Uncharacterized protein n=1 Tax=Marmota monax TaxID=9995 RepID=A0A5E4CK75_MARMO|nr:hypothetical protein GHT09_011448 [Marmota monax]VTJ82274.1 Hypothetical predicted protein [Marmota monax]
MCREGKKQTLEKGIFVVMTLSGEREGICLFFPNGKFFPVDSMTLASFGGGRILQGNCPAREPSPGETPEHKDLQARPENPRKEWRAQLPVPIYLPARSAFGPASRGGPGRMEPQGLQELLCAC